MMQASLLCGCVQILLAPLMLLMGMVVMFLAHNTWLTFARHQPEEQLQLGTTTG